MKSAPRKTLPWAKYLKYIARPTLLPAFLFASILVEPHGAHALVIDALYDSSVTSSEQTIISSAISTYEKMFTNPMSVTIEFVTGSISGGSSMVGDYLSPYASYTNSLAANAVANGNTIEATAYNNLSHGNTAAQVLFTSADGRALGCLSCSGTVAGTGSVSSSTLVDGIVTIGSGYYGNSSQVIYHEIDEVLGIGGQGSVINSSMTSSPPLYNGQTTIGALDLYRYSAPGVASLTNSTSATSYFSINGGATNIVGFNQSGVGDYGDWAASSGCYIQTYDTCTNPAPLSTLSPEGVALQAIGYDVAVPEPSTVAILAVGLLGLSLARRKSRVRISR